MLEHIERLGQKKRDGKAKIAKIKSTNGPMDVQVI